MRNDVYVAEQYRRALELFIQSIDDESTMMEVADVYPEYKIGVAYKIGNVFRYGENNDGESQLYQVLQAHTSSAEWTPGTAVSLYKAIGITAAGVAVWTQPLGAADAYQVGDIVEHNGQNWTCTCENNVWEPGVYGWEEVS